MPTSPPRSSRPFDENEDYEPFLSAEEAWFWYIRCEVARKNRSTGSRADAHRARPCEPSDIYRWIERLFDKGRLLPVHLLVMGEYGYLNRYPDPTREEEAIDFLVWYDAFEEIKPALIDKGVVR